MHPAPWNDVDAVQEEPISERRVAPLEKEFYARRRREAE